MNDSSWFEKFLDTNSIIVGVIVNTATNSVAIYGTPESLESNSLLHYYFTDAKKLTVYLKDRLLPVMLQQDDIAGVISKPDENTIVGLLYRDTKSVIDRYHHSQTLSNRLCDAWQAKH